MNVVAAPAQQPTRFTKIRNANGDHIITRDNHTGLEWTARYGNFYTNELNNPEAEEACRKLRLGDYSDWRLPTLDELLTLVDRSRAGPVHDIDAFQIATAPYFWTSTPSANSPIKKAWAVNFDDGSCAPEVREYVFSIRPVRDSNAAAAKAGA